MMDMKVDLPVELKGSTDGIIKMNALERGKKMSELFSGLSDDDFLEISGFVKDDKKQTAEETQVM